MPDLATNGTILVVDDNEDLRVLVAETLKRLGKYQVIMADNGIDGLQAFYDHRPDCAVIDIKMPGLDGVQLARALRGDPETAATPLVILTALVQDRDRFIGLAAGADQYLVKPVRPLDLVAAVRYALAVSAVERDQALRALIDTPIPGEVTHLPPHPTA